MWAVRREAQHGQGVTDDDLASMAQDLELVSFELLPPLLDALINEPQRLESERSAAGNSALSVGAHDQP